MRKCNKFRMFLCLMSRIQHLFLPRKLALFFFPTERPAVRQVDIIDNTCEYSHISKMSKRKQQVEYDGSDNDDDFDVREFAALEDYKDSALEAMKKVQAKTTHINNTVRTIKHSPKPSHKLLNSWNSDIHPLPSLSGTGGSFTEDWRDYFA